MIEHNTTTLLDQEELGTLIAQGGGVGSWQLLSGTCPINPISAALLRTGRVFFIAGSGNNPGNVNEPAGSVVWDASTGFRSPRPVTPVDGAGFPLDLFCVGHSFLADGRLMCVGGTDQYDPWRGLAAAVIFDPSTERWTKEASQPDGSRWYPTAMTLGDGRVFAMTGLDEYGGIDTYPEAYIPGTGWRYFSGEDTGWAYPTSKMPMYSHLFLMQDGRIFFSGAYFESTGVTARILTLPASGTGQIIETPVGGLANPEYGDQAASVLLPPAQDQRVMIIGGGNSFYGQTTNRVNIIDLKVGNPSYAPAASLNFARMHACAVLLPNRTVFICNGSAAGEDVAQSTLAGEIYNPATNTWTITATASVARQYHSLALLLPDGRVLTAGGNSARAISEERRLEIYSPPYISQTRPVINSAPATVAYGATITIDTSQAGQIKWVNLIKPMAITHSMDTEQRIVNVPFTRVSGTNRLRATVTNQRNIAPPGYYMLSVTNNSNVPSVAKWIRLG